MTFRYYISFFFFFNDTATTEIYTLSLHDALPIYGGVRCKLIENVAKGLAQIGCRSTIRQSLHRRRQVLYCLLIGLSGDRKSTRLNSSHLVISYAVFCLKKKKKTQNERTMFDK